MDKNTEIKFAGQLNLWFTFRQKRGGVHNKKCAGGIDISLKKMKQIMQLHYFQGENEFGYTLTE